MGQCTPACATAEVEENEILIIQSIRPFKKPPKAYQPPCLTCGDNDDVED